MSRRTGLGRHSRLEDAAGDPLDSLVNLFDIGIVIAVAFLVSGLGLTLDRSTNHLRQRTTTTRHAQALPTPSPSAHTTRGRGQAVGTVYRLSNGQLVYVQREH